MLEQNGRFIYSGADTIRPGSVYLLGLNPGGDPKFHYESIRAEIEGIDQRTLNAYIDECWGEKRRKRGNGEGKAPVQKRIRALLEGLDLPTRDVCAANLIFVRSRDGSGSGYPETADACWPVHQFILDIIRPKLIIAYGNSGRSPYSYIRGQYKHPPQDTRPSGHGNWKCRAFQIPDGPRVVGLPHLSRYAIDRHPEVIAWVRAML